MAKKVKVGIKIPTKNELFKRYPGMAIASSIDDDKLPKIPSRFLRFTNQLGGGIPYGKILEIFGEESSGKSLAAFDFAYVTQQLGGVVLWADAEQSFTNSWAIANGLNLDKVILIRDTTIEVISDWIADMAIYWRSILVHNEPILLVVDSVAALDCSMNINSRMTDSKADMGNRAKAFYKMLRIRSEILYKLGVSQIYINQLRKNLSAGLFSDPDTTPGGKALAFYASIRVGFYGGKQITKKIKSKEIKIGRVTSIRIKKNKVAPPRETIKGAPIFNNPDHSTVGFDRYYGFDELLSELGIIEISHGGIFKFNNKVICKGKDNFIPMLEDNQDLRKILIRKSKINTISKTSKYLTSLTENQFSVDNDISYESQNDNEDE